MSYEPGEEAYDEWAAQLSREAVEQFSKERLFAVYAKEHRILSPAMGAIQRAQANGGADISLVLGAAAIEWYLKMALLRPIMRGLVHVEALADLIVDRVVGKQDWVSSSVELVKPVFEHLTGTNISGIRRPGVTTPLWQECAELREARNRFVHLSQSTKPNPGASLPPIEVALAVQNLIVLPLLDAIGVEQREHGLAIKGKPSGWVGTSTSKAPGA